MFTATGNGKQLGRLLAAFKTIDPVPDSYEKFVGMLFSLFLVGEFRPVVSGGTQQRQKCHLFFGTPDFFWLQMRSAQDDTVDGLYATARSSQ